MKNRSRSPMAARIAAKRRRALLSSKRNSRVLSKRASAKVVANAGTGYYAMHLHARYGEARRRFTPQQLLANAEMVTQMRGQGAPARELVKFYPPTQVRAVLRRIAAERRVRRRSPKHTRR